jgi:hypothetical protein
MLGKIVAKHFSMREEENEKLSEAFCYLSSYSFT